MRADPSENARKGWTRAGLRLTEPHQGPARAGSIFADDGRAGGVRRDLDARLENDDHGALRGDLILDGACVRHWRAQERQTKDAKQHSHR